jgi:hypothetical protein
MRPFGEAKSISGHQTLQLMRRPYRVKGSVYVVTLPAFQRCLEDGPDEAERQPGLCILSLSVELLRILCKSVAKRNVRFRSKRVKYTERAISLHWEQIPHRQGDSRRPSRGTSRPTGNTGETWEDNPIGSQRIHSTCSPTDFIFIIF